MKRSFWLLGVFILFVSCQEPQEVPHTPEVNVVVSIPDYSTNVFASDGSSDDDFAHSVSISADGTVVVCGSPASDAMGSSSGAVYVYTWENGVWEEEKLIVVDGAVDDYFGNDVAVSADGSTIAVGAYGDDDNGSASGSLYIFKRVNGEWQHTKYVSGLTGANDQFAMVVDVSGDGNVIVAAIPGDDENGTDAGALLVLSWDGGNWNELKLIPETGLGTDEAMADSVAVSDDGKTIVAGVIKDAPSGAGSGSAYVFSYTGDAWKPWKETRLIAFDGTDYDRFGKDVAVNRDGSVILVGAFRDDDTGTDVGSAYVYTLEEGTWNEIKIMAYDRAASDFYGAAVALSGDGSTMAIGAYQDDDVAANGGSVYVYKWQGSVWIPWTVTKLLPQALLAGDQFGFSLDLDEDGSHLVVGALTGDGNNTDSGTAFIFSWDGTDWE